jgi:hypothetical protein
MLRADDPKRQASSDLPVLFLPQITRATGIMLAQIFTMKYLHSIAGCWEQPPQTDFGEEETAPDGSMPLSFVVSVQDGTRLIIFNSDGRRFELVLPKGSLIAFTPYACHAGPAYGAGHVRVFLSTKRTGDVVNCVFETGDEEDGDEMDI